MPQAILLEDVESLGEKGTIVDVSSGYLRNFLLPRKLAESATKGSVEAAAKRREAAEREAREAVDRARENAELLGKTVLTIPQQAMTVACSARSPPRTSSTRSTRLVVSASTSARSSSTIRSRASARTWSPSRLSMA
jgi:Ribosomal protein L9, N-terminal domain